MNIMSRGRKKGSGYNSQFLILDALASGPKSSKELRRLTRLSKNTIWYNVQILKGIKAIITIRKGRSVLYRLDEHPQRKLLFFHASMGNKWAKKSLKKLRRILRLLPKSIRPIEEMYRMVRKYRSEIEELKNKFPELCEKDIWSALGLVQQIKFVQCAKKYKDRSYIVKEPCSHERFVKKRNAFINFCRKIDAMLKDWADTVLLRMYFEFLIECLPEVLDFAERHGNRNYHVPFKLAAEFDDFVRELIQKRRSCIEQYRKKIEKEIDEVIDYAVRLLRNETAS